jgi:hypothetical protein
VVPPLASSAPSQSRSRREFQSLLGRCSFQTKAILLSQAAAGEMHSSAGGSYQALIAFQSCLARFPAGVAQSAERLIRNEQVRGSIPLPGSFPGQGPSRLNQARNGP